MALLKVGGHDGIGEGPHINEQRQNDSLDFVK